MIFMAVFSLKLKPNFGNSLNLKTNYWFLEHHDLPTVDQVTLMGIKPLWKRRLIDKNRSLSKLSF